MQVVIGGCHSLMDVDGVLHGDPLEASALEGIRWSWNATSHTARPRSGDAVGSEPAGVVSGGSGDGETAAAEEGEKDAKRGARRTGAKEGAVGGGGGAQGPGGGAGVAAAVWRRYAFSSQLQRMSVIAEVSGGGVGGVGGGSVGSGGGGAASLTAEDAGPEVRVVGWLRS